MTTYFLALMAAVMALDLLYAAGKQIPPANPNTATYLLAFLLGWAAVLCIWRRFWFLPSDLVTLLKARGASSAVVRQLPNN
jgi:hypothetical protein